LNPLQPALWATDVVSFADWCVLRAKKFIVLISLKVNVDTPDCQNIIKTKRLRMRRNLSKLSAQSAREVGGDISSPQRKLWVGVSTNSQ
jgi:hypothetical protein